MLKTNSLFGRGTVEYVTPSVFVLEIASEGAVLSNSPYGDPGKAGSDGSYLEGEDF